MTEAATTSETTLTVVSQSPIPDTQYLTPAAPPATALIVDQIGAYVGKHSERIRVTVKKEVVAEAPLLFLEQILVVGRAISVSSDAIEACCERGIPVYFVSFRGEPYAALYAAGLGGTVVTRRAQLTAFGTAKGIALGCAFASGKIASQANLLRYVAKYRKTTDLTLYRELRLRAGEVLDHIAEIRRLWEEAEGAATI